MTYAIGNGSPLSLALAEELRLASRMLNQLADDLCSDGAILRRHMTSLQSIDHVNQIQSVVADFLCDEGSGIDLLESVPLADMAERLHRVLSGNQPGG